MNHSRVSKKRLILYSSESNGIVARLQASLRGLVLDEMMEVYDGLEDLALRLRRKRGNIFAAILLILNQEDLWRLNQIKAGLDGLRIILILPDQKRETLSLGHKLGPRYLTYADSDFRDIRAVLERMLEKQGRVHISKVS